MPQFTMIRSGGSSVAVEITIGKILALLIAIGYAVGTAVHAHGVTPDLVGGCVILLLPLALIWFPEEMGSFTGYVGRGGSIDTETPPILVSIAGWFFLVGLPVLMYFLS